jgi:molecular chaperone HtpG
LQSATSSGPNVAEAVADVRVSDRLTDSAVCLVAPEHGPDRQLERLLAGAGRITTAAKPILEVNPRHPLIVSLAGLGEDEKSFKDDAAHLLLDEARVLDGERPADVPPPVQLSVLLRYPSANKRRGCCPRGGA